MSEEQNANSPQTEQSEEERLREVREWIRKSKTFVDMTEPGKGIAIIGGVRIPPKGKREKLE